MDGIAGVYGVKDPELVNKTFLATAACQHRGKECLNELAVQRAFKGSNPYDKTLEEINRAVA